MATTFVFGLVGVAAPIGGENRGNVSSQTVIALYQGCGLSGSEFAQAHVSGCEEAHIS